MDLFDSPEFSLRVKALMEQHHVPGLSIAIVQDETIVSRGYGQISLDPPIACTADTLFDIASASKSLTTASVGILVEDNEKYPEVQYTATMSSLLPGDFVISEPGHTESITLEDILSHRSGMPRHDSSYLGPRATQPDDARSVTRNLRNLPVAAPVRTKFIYCNMMYTVATYLVEKKSGLPFAEFLQKHFFEPLEMQSTSLQPEAARARGLGHRITPGYSWDSDSERYKKFQPLDCPEAQGAGSVITSVNDYIRWVKAMMNHEGPITEEIYKGLIKSRTLQNPDAENLQPLTSPVVDAAGWEIWYYRGYMIVSHDGEVPGFGATHFFLPHFKFGGAIFGNSSDGGIVASIVMRELIDEVLKVPRIERPDWNSIISAGNADSDGDEEEKLRQQLCPGITEPEPQKIPLSVYTGTYWNKGYHSFMVQHKDDRLFVDATDRSMGFTLTLDHICDQTKYIAHLSDSLEGGDEPIMAQFRIEGDRATMFGVKLETEIDELIWFTRVQ
ncbi:beta-lactamase family protein [Paecilomyces variotii No. 5]|uniref:Beta-lactamase family protein n=1 Tax=Byssochlamys spectabilis (strain No. 5 / NBRC 109023) TaxID=1356009 RepID=V5FXW4_BYSSN|nr:beta-lactamase family protein [Paecilomyces variotii No. 5]